MVIMIPFRVIPISLPSKVEYRAGSYELDGAICGIVADRPGIPWIVVAIKPNPPYSIIWGTGGMPREACFVLSGRDSLTSLACDLFLLARNSETPIWYPALYCKIVGEEND